MDLAVAEAIVRELLAPQYLSPIQQQVFSAAWAGEGYREFAERTGYEFNYIKGAGAQIWQLLSAATDRRVTKTNFRAILAELAPLVLKDLPVAEPRERDWQLDANSIACYGREGELELLQQWISIERCREVAILGMGGSGKTALAQALVRSQTRSSQDDERFSYVCWYSLLVPLPLADLLPELLRSLIEGLDVGASVAAALARAAASVVAQIELLVEMLRTHRCLLVFDNCESLFQAGMPAGTYRPEYANYGDLFSRVGQVQHQSCLVLVSREKPNEIAQLAGIDAEVRELVLTGVDKSVADRIFADRGCTPPTLAEWSQIVEYGDGNPLVLHAIATTVRSVAAGNTSEIIPSLQSPSLGFAEIHILLEQQWERLSEPELQAIYWLAIARSSLAVDELSAYVHPDWHHESGRKCLLPSILQSLHRRHLVSIQTRGANRQRQWSLLPMTIEYALDRLVAKLAAEIESARPELLDTHAIAPATALEYIRQQQLQTIVRPLLERLRSSLGSTSQIDARLRQILAAWRDRPRSRGYLAGNILTLLIELQVDLVDLDLTGVTIRQAYLAAIDLASIGLTAQKTIDCTLADNFAQILTVAYSPNGHIFAAGDRRGEIRLWHEGCDDSPSGTLRERGELVCTGHTDAVRAIAFSPDSRYLASVSDDRTIAIWQVGDGRLDLTIAAGMRGSSLSFSPNGRYLAVGGERIIYYWDLTTQMCVHQLVGHSERVLSLSHHPYGGKLASGSADGAIRIWDLAVGTNGSIGPASSHAITVVAYSPDGRTLLSGSLDGKLRLWDAAQPTAAPGLEIRDVGGEIYAAAFSPDGLQVAIAGSAGRLGIWCAASGNCLHRWTTTSHQSARTLAFRPDGEAIATAGDDRTICFWQARSGLCARILTGTDRGFNSICWRADDRAVVFGSSDGRIGTYALANRQASHVFTAHARSLLALAVGPHGRTVATSGDDLAIKIWDADTLVCTRTLRGIPPQHALAYSANGRYLVGASERTIRIWDTQHWQYARVDTGHTDRIIALAHHPDRDLFASSSDDRTVRLWQASEDAPSRTLDCFEPILALAFDPRGTILATGSSDDRIYLWNIDTGELSHTLCGHSGRILSIAYSPDGNWLCSGASDRAIKIWSPATGLCTTTLNGHQDWVTALAISSCSRTLASASADGSIRLWEIATGSCIDVYRQGGAIDR